MAWGVRLNQDHVRLWRGYLLAWLAFVGFGLVIGAHLKPRPDEVAFMLVLPLAVLVPYASLCFVGAVLRSLWASGAGWRRSLVGHKRFRIHARP